MIVYPSCMCGRRLKSRKSFIKTTKTLTDPPHRTRIELWQTQLIKDYRLSPKEELASGNELRWSSWRSLNRLRAFLGRSKTNLHKWIYATDNICSCGELSTMEHKPECPNCSAKILNIDDLFILFPSDSAVELAEY